jgi:hypothetical protein
MHHNLLWEGFGFDDRRNAQWQVETHATAAVAGVAGGNVTVMRFDNGAADAQAQTDTGDIGFAVTAFKQLEHLVQLVSGETFAGVAHTDFHLRG